MNATPACATSALRPTPATLCRIVHCAVDELNEVIDPFSGADASFVERRRETEPGNPLLDLSHESLIRQWETLRAWADSEAEKLEVFRRVADDAEGWVKAGKSSEYLERAPSSAISRNGGGRTGRRWSGRSGTTPETECRGKPPTIFRWSRSSGPRAFGRAEGAAAADSLCHCGGHCGAGGYGRRPSHPP